MRRFELHREEDESGISGTGVVAQGCEFDNGRCAVVWKSMYGTQAFYDNITCVRKVHGHEGRTQVVWVDQEESNDSD